MRSFTILLAVASAVNAQSSRPTATRPASASSTFSEPCAQVSASVAASNQDQDQITVPAQVAYDCLNSVPIDKDGDTALISELQDYLQWQSTLQYLKDPPDTYHGGPPGGIDLMGGLDQIKQGISNGTYTNEYQAQFAITDLLVHAYDGHLGYRSDIIRNVFTFTRFQGLISLSSDGIALPQVYFVNDLAKVALGEKFNASTIQQINGQPVEQYLEKFANNTYPGQDIDNRYNGMFPNQAGLSMGVVSDGIFSTGHFDGSNTSFTVSNSSTPIVVTNYAIVKQNFTGVDSGKALAQQYLSGPSDADMKRRKRDLDTHQAKAAPWSIQSIWDQAAAEAAATTGVPDPTAATVRVAASSTAADNSAPSATGYPDPVVIASSLAISGYYLNGTGYDDIAVLSIPTYAPESEDEDADPDAEFQEVLSEFLKDAVAKNKKKLVIDVRNNPGGDVVLGFETFKQLFPQIVPFGASRWRAHDAVNVIGAATADIQNNATIRDSDPEDWEYAMEVLRLFDYAHHVDVNDAAFKTFNDWYGPNKFDNDQYTSLMRYNFSDPLSDPGAINVTGYGNLTNPPAQPFSPENIVILSDGTCASTCTIFAELMREQAKVTTIAIGGRPINKPMQGVGGTRGSQDLTGPLIQGYANATIEAVALFYGADTAEHVSNTIVGRLANPTQLLKRTAYTAQGWGLGINFADNIRMNDTKEIPLQFVDQMADCKIFQTLDGWMDVSNVWKLAADVKWNGKACVSGSTGDPTAISMVKGAEVSANNTQQGTGGKSGKSGAAGLGVSGLAVAVVAGLVTLLM